VCDGNNDTPLHLATAGGDRGAVELLIKYGASIQGRNKQRKLVFDVCASRNRAAIQRLIQTNINKEHHQAIYSLLDFSTRYPFVDYSASIPVRLSPPFFSPDLGRAQ
jgi:ankyrin repeat protein